MNISINATLLVQIFNFFIAYLILRNLFFKPALAELRQAEHNLVDLEQHIEMNMQAIDTNNRVREAQWHEVHRFAQINGPQNKMDELHYFRDLTPQLQAVHMTEQEVEHAIRDAITELKQKIRKITYV